MQPTIGLNNQGGYIAFRATDNGINLLGIVCPGECGPVWRGMLLFSFLQIVFDARPNIKVHMNADQSIWKD